MRITEVVKEWSWQVSVRVDPGSALTDLFQRYSEALYRYALSLSGRAALAEDAVQEVFLRLSSDVTKLKEIRQPKAYLYRAVRHQIQRRPVDWEELPHDDTFASDSLSPEDRSDLVTALKTLPAEQREVIFMKEVLKLSFREISEALEISLNTAASRHRYALQKLRNELNPEAISKELSHA
jgi:RNA polymerase sigma-70 factor (ECF subfamily)